jgi:hypothetical protein
MKRHGIPIDSQGIPEAIQGRRASWKASPTYITLNQQYFREGTA